MRLRVIAPVVLVLVVTAGAVFLVTAAVERDAERETENRARIAAANVQNTIEQASDLVESLRQFMLGQGGGSVTNEQLADFGARVLAPAGLPAAAWVMQAQGSSLRATLVTGASPMTAPGVELSGQEVLTAAFGDPRTLFRATATPLAAARDGRAGLFLVESGPRLSGGALEPGFVVLFVPASWLVTTAVAGTEQTAAQLQLRIGRTSYGPRKGATVGNAFSAAGQRFEVGVPERPVTRTAALLPWLVLAAGLVLAPLSWGLGASAERRARAQHEVDRIFTLSPDPIAVVAPDGHFRRVNPAFERLLGYTSGELLARPVLDFIHPDDRERSRRVGEELRAGGSTLGFENRYVCKDGSLRWLEWTVTRAHEGAIYAAGRDVTDRRATDTQEAALRRIATLATERAQPDELFNVVAEEVARVVGVPLARVVRYEPGDVAVECGTFATDSSVDIFPQYVSLDGPSVLQLVRETGKAARVDDYTHLSGKIADAARRAGIRSAVGSPIVVAGRLWGAVVASSREQLPDRTEQRLADFTDLLASAIANAESRDAVERLVDEQAALRRVATLVAEGVPPQDLFLAVVEGVGSLLPVGSAAMGRFEPDGFVTTVAAWSTGEVAFRPGVRWSTEGQNVTGIVFRTGRPARLDDFSDASGPIGLRAREAGYRSVVGSPITVEGRLWGAVTAASTADEPLPPETESRLASFTELVATAIANAESREALERLVEQQAALRRVATLVAEGAPPHDLFAAAAMEVARVFDLSPETSDVATVVRFDPGPACVLVGMSNSIEGLPLESLWQPKDLYVSTRVSRTGRSGRVSAQELDAVDDPDADALRRQRLLSQVGSPIVVDGRLWGALTINAYEELPPDTEERLEKFTELVATAIANAESAYELAASRARIVTASDEARRRIERDLHDGAQQRLVSLGLELRMAGSSPPSERTAG